MSVTLCLPWLLGVVLCEEHSEGEETVEDEVYNITAETDGSTPIHEFKTCFAPRIKK
jgi:hypothetical protein